eukprot:GHUV01024202.1.p1 GENE.GHUV01024202.1~~GHUV01024202.1.p1  ORF type:complete len:244 (+),score=37.75 GHUV01024202.1:328-1059(+)
MPLRHIASSCHCSMCHTQLVATTYFFVSTSFCRGLNWADNGVFKLTINYIDFSNFAAYGIRWKPDPDELANFEPLKGLEPAKGKRGCCTYKANKYDLLSRVAMQAEVEVGQLLADNPDIGKGPYSLRSPLTGNSLLICKSQVCKDKLDDLKAAGRRRKLMAAGPPDYAVTARRVANKKDIDCGYIDEFNRHVPYCKVCGGVEKVAAQCDANQQCVAFDMEIPQLKNGTWVECGYLKGAFNTLE